MTFSNDLRARRKLKAFYRRLLKEFGPQDWWPGETPFEVMVGAILTQNTNWGNVEKAIANLKKRRHLTPQSLKKISARQLASLIRPAGYFNVKAKRLKNFIEFVFREYKGDLKRMAREQDEQLRAKLLRVNGIGEETADSILLYAFEKPFFVVDAYTKRVLCRHRLISRNADYADVQKLFTRHLPEDIEMFNEYHALIVRLGKELCRTKPDCFRCPLRYDLKRKLK